LPGEIYTNYLGLRVELAAPTGRAAKRIQESTGYAARTIHRLLEFSPKDGGFTRNQSNPLDADVVIIDEASMNDTLIAYHLVKAIRPGASLILVGDVNQLPSVGPGNVLRDIINSGAFKVTTLNEIFRQAQGSLIVTNAHRINSGEFPVLRQSKDSEKSDFFFFEQKDPDDVLKTILRIYKDAIPRTFGYASKNIQVLSPMHRGIVGVGNLNTELQKLMNSGAKEINRYGTIFKIGDKVLQRVNNYDRDVFNGDIGIIADINTVDQEMRVNFDGKEVTYDFNDLDELVLAYAISVHKAQGSEYPVLILPVTMQHYIMLARNLIYTGITRGKKLSVLVGSKQALYLAIRNNKTGMRYSGLQERIQHMQIA
jgi:exodeoxyribonuclease V alpha subunit